MVAIDRKISDLTVLTTDELSLSDKIVLMDVSEPTNRKTKTSELETVANVLADNILKNSFNPIINGQFLLWQRGTSFSSISSAAYSADRWIYLKSGAMVHTLSRSTDVPTVAEAGKLLKYSLKADCTTADSSIAASDYCSIDTRIEGYNFEKIAQQAFTLSFWVKAPATGTYCVGFLNSGGDRCFIAEYTITTANTWEFKEISVLASPSGGTWDYTTGIGLSVRFILTAGTDYQSTAGSWLSSSNKFATANQINAVGNTSYDFYLADVSINLGEVAITAIPRTIQEEIDLCLRYYEILGYGCTGAWYSSSACSMAGQFSTEKRSTPTISLISTTPVVIEVGVAERTGSSSALVSSNANVSGFIVDINGFSSATIGKTSILKTNAIEANSEL